MAAVKLHNQIFLFLFHNLNFFEFGKYFCSQIWKFTLHCWKTNCKLFTFFLEQNGNKNGVQQINIIFYWVPKFIGKSGVWKFDVERYFITACQVGSNYFFTPKWFEIYASLVCRKGFQNKLNKKKRKIFLLVSTWNSVINSRFFAYLIFVSFFLLKKFSAQFIPSGEYLLSRPFSIPM
jgi:hypothetical protein